MKYPKSQKPSDLLSWAHFVEILKLEYPHRTIGQQSADRPSWSQPVIARICQALSLQGALASHPTVEGILYAVCNKSGRLIEILRVFPLFKGDIFFLQRPPSRHTFSSTEPAKAMRASVSSNRRVAFFLPKTLKGSRLEQGALPKESPDVSRSGQLAPKPRHGGG